MNGTLRKILAGSLIVVLLFTVYGCGAGKSGAVSKDAETKQENVVSETSDSPGVLTEETETTEVETTEAEGTEAEEPVQTGASSYDEILEHFYTIVSSPDEDYGDAPGEMGVLESARGIGDNALDAMGYAIEDLSGDGIPELVVGTLPEYGGMVNVVYTLVDGKPQFVFEGWYRNMYSYMGSGTFFYSASNSAMESGQGTFVLTRDGTALECQSFLFTHPDDNGSGDLRVYYNTTGSWDPAESENADMTVEDFWALDPAGGVLPLTPFSSFGSDTPVVSVRWLEEAGSLTDYDECSISSENEGTSFIVFIPQRPVKMFTILSLTVVDVSESGSIEFEAYPETSGPNGEWLERPLVAEVSFAGDLPQYGFQYEDENGDVRRFALEISGRDGSILVREADRDYFGFVLRGGNTEETEHNSIPVLTCDSLPFDHMETIVCDDNNPDGRYYYEDTTSGGIVTVVNCAYYSWREVLGENLQDYITSCAEGLGGYRTRDVYAEKNETYSGNLGCPVYVVHFTTGENEDMRAWTVLGTEAYGYIYLYGFHVWGEEALELEDMVSDSFGRLRFME